MTRAELTERLLDIKRDKGWSWKQICSEIGGMSPVLITGALLGQMKLTRPQAAKAAELFGLSKSEQALLNEVPHRGTAMPPTDPLIYRFYELVMVNGPALKALIEEEFGDGIMSAIDSIWRSSVCPIRKATASSSPCRASSCRTDTTARPATRRPTAIRKSSYRHSRTAQRIWSGMMIRSRPGQPKKRESDPRVMPDRFAEPPLAATIRLPV